VWYGPLFASGFIMGYIIISKIFAQEGKPEKDLDSLLMYMVISTVLGARLGHCLFYEPEVYLKNPIKILYIWEGGLASHGAMIAILLGLYLYSKNKIGQSFLWIVDRVVIVVALGGAMIRLGNLTNHEIIGKPADVPQAFIFTNSLRMILKESDKDFSHFKLSPQTQKKDTTIKGVVHKPMLLKAYFSMGGEKERPAAVAGFIYRAANQKTELAKHFAQIQVKSPKVSTEDTYQVVEMDIYAIPRHPAQLYEAISTFLLFLFLWWLYGLRKEKTPEGLLLAIFLIVLFTLRFFYEFLKENQVDFEDNLKLNMGQILSIPPVILGFILLVFIKKKK
jgi:prolipoprotein diacylglyceryltransferase